MSQGILQGKLTRYANNPTKLKELMLNATEEEKQLGRSHLRTVMGLKAKGSKK